jgi:hypothetical protein
MTDDQAAEAAEARELLEDADDAREAREALAWLEAGEQPVPAAQVWAELGLEPGDPGWAAAYARTHRVLCAHADEDGRGAHWLEPGEKCPDATLARPDAGREAGQ